MDEDFQSFIVDPDLVDPGIDVSGLNTQTSTRPELLFDLPEFSGIKVDPTTNLTRTQKALLSPEEQIIASRK